MDSNVLYFLMFILIIAFFINKGRYNAKQARQRQAAIRDQVDHLAEQHNLQISHRHDGLEITMVTDQVNGKIGFFNTRRNTWHDYLAKDLISVEMFEDGQSILKSGRMRQVGGALVGGMIAGGTGALIGGLGTAHRSKDVVNRIELRIVVDDPDNPTRDIPFLTGQVLRNSPQHQFFDSEARAWHGRLAALIRAEDSLRERLWAEQQHVSTPPLPSSVADELAKLAELRTAGVLNEEEFQSQKGRLLGD